MGYTTDEEMVRVDIFRDNFKWYATVAMYWDRYTSENPITGYENIYDTFKRCMSEQFREEYQGMIAVCLKPYHKHSHPLMIRIGE